MKQALLITAYKEMNQLIELISKFDDHFNVYIHFDKKSKLKHTEKIKLQRLSNVKYFCQEFKVNWGSINHLKAYLHLCKIALKDSENEYFHLITGQDYPIKSIQHFKTLFDNLDKDTPSYLEYFTIPTTNWHEGGLDRVKYFNLHNYLNAKTRIGGILLRYSIFIQKLLKIDRALDFQKPLYGGSTYWSLSGETLAYVLAYNKNNPWFLKKFKYSFCPEEFYFQTIIMNSVHSKNIINENLRYVDWESNRGGVPAFLDETDFETLINSNKLFCRKVSSLRSIKLKQLLNQQLFNR